MCMLQEVEAQMKDRLMLVTSVWMEMEWAYLGVGISWSWHILELAYLGVGGRRAVHRVKPRG
jgi:hypothetical protein